VEEDAAYPTPDSHALLDDPEIAGHPSVEDEDMEEEGALFGGPVSHVEPGALEAPNAERAVEKAEAKAVATAPAAKQLLDVPEGVDPNEFRKWSRGLRNKS